MSLTNTLAYYDSELIVVAKMLYGIGLKAPVLSKSDAVFAQWVD